MEDDERRSDVMAPRTGFVSEFARQLDLISTPHGIRTHAAEVAKSGDPDLLRILLSSPYTPRKVLVDLSSQGRSETLPFYDWRLKRLARTVASSAATPPPLDRKEIAERAKRRFLALSRAAKGRIRAGSIKRILSETCAPEVLALIAGDAKVPDSILQSLSRSCWWWVRTAVAGNASANTHLLEILARDVDERVRVAVAGNPTTSSRILRSLLIDERQAVRTAASEALTARNGESLFLVRESARRPDTSAKTLSAATEAVSDAGTTSAIEQEALPEFITFDAFELDAPRVTTFTDTRRGTDTIAVRAVVGFVRRIGHQPGEMPHNNEGFDLTSVRPDGTRLLIEVKGASPRARSVQLTRAQLDFAATHKDQYVLAVVLHDGQDPQELLWWPNPMPERPPAIFAAVEIDLAELRHHAHRVRLQGASSSRTRSPLFDLGQDAADTVH